MSDAGPQSALREWRDHIRHPATLVALGAVALILALVGPYGTSDLLRPLPRLGYWALIVPATYGTGSLTVTILRAVLPSWPFCAAHGGGGRGCWDGSGWRCPVGECNRAGLCARIRACCPALS